MSNDEDQQPEERDVAVLTVYKDNVDLALAGIVHFEDVPVAGSVYLEIKCLRTLLLNDRDLMALVNAGAFSARIMEMDGLLFVRSKPKTEGVTDEQGQITGTDFTVPYVTNTDHEVPLTLTFWGQGQIPDRLQQASMRVLLEPLRPGQKAEVPPPAVKSGQKDIRQFTDLSKVTLDDLEHCTTGQLRKIAGARKMKNYSKAKKEDLLPRVQAAFRGEPDPVAPAGGAPPEDNPPDGEGSGGDDEQVIAAIKDEAKKEVLKTGVENIGCKYEDLTSDELRGIAHGLRHMRFGKGFLDSQIVEMIRQQDEDGRSFDQGKV